MTLQGALRYDHAWSYFPEQTVGPVALLPDGDDVPAHARASRAINDLRPRGGVAYDRVRQRQDVAQGQLRPLSRSGAERRARSSRSIRPAVCRRRRRARGPTANGNFVPDCDLLNPAAQNLSATGGDVCGVDTNANFGTEVFESTLDPALLSGWGVRSGDWQWGASVQQEVLPRVSVELGYQRRWLVNFPVTDNRARGAARTTRSFGVNVPTDPRLPDGGGGSAAGPLQRHADGGGAAERQLPDAGDRLRRLDAGRQLDQSERHRAAAHRPGAAGRLQHGQHRQRLLRRPSTIPEWTVLGAQSPTNPWCDTSTGWITRVHRSRHLHGAEDRRAGRRHVPQRPGRVAGRELGGAQLGNRRLNRPFAGVAGHDGHRQPDRAGHALRRSRQPVRHAVREDPAVRRARAPTSASTSTTSSNAAPVLSYNQTFVADDGTRGWRRRRCCSRGS